MVTIRQLQRVNTLRANRWHTNGIQDWSPLEWAGAMCGESGEAANFAKKLKRLEGKLKNLDRRNLSSPVMEDLAEDYRKNIAKEVADAIIYGVLLIERVGLSAEDVIKEVFNKKSEEYEFPERL